MAVAGEGVRGGGAFSPVWGRSLWPQNQPQVLRAS